MKKSKKSKSIKWRPVMQCLLLKQSLARFLIILPELGIALKRVDIYGSLDFSSSPKVYLQGEQNSPSRATFISNCYLDGVHNSASLIDNMMWGRGYPTSKKLYQI